MVVDIVKSQIDDENSPLYLPPLERFQYLSEFEAIRDAISTAKRLGQSSGMMALDAAEERTVVWDRIDELLFIDYSAKVSRRSASKG